MRQEGVDMAIDSHDDNDDSTTDMVSQTTSRHKAGPGKGKSLMSSVKNMVRLMTKSRSMAASRATQSSKCPNPEPAETSNPREKKKAKQQDLSWQQQGPTRGGGP